MLTRSHRKPPITTPHQRFDWCILKIINFPVQSLCEHHLLPFHGTAHIGYLPGQHLCMSLRSVRATGSQTVTSALHGLLREDARSRQEFFALTGIR
jgi:GTP cyclohydrolase I